VEHTRREGGELVPRLYGSAAFLDLYALLWPPVGVTLGYTLLNAPGRAGDPEMRLDAGRCLKALRQPRAMGRPVGGLALCKRSSHGVVWLISSRPNHISAQRRSLHRCRASPKSRTRIITTSATDAVTKREQNAACGLALRNC